MGDCVEYYDGCNSCLCRNGYLHACTEMTCLRKKEPRCVVTEQCPVDCRNYFDGCNTCTCKNGKLTECTEMACAEMEEAKCMDDEINLRWSFDELSDFCKENKNNEEECAKVCGKPKKGKCKGYKSAKKVKCKK